MEPLYQLCAVVGGTIFVGQFVLSFIGLTGDHEFSGDAGGDHFDGGGDHVDSAGHDSGGDGHHGSGAMGHDAATWWFVGLLSFRTAIAGLTFFGLAGLAADASGVGVAGTLAIAALSGLAALYLVAWMMRSLMRLRADGTVRIENTVGQTAMVYLTIPGHRAGKGKVTVTVQNRTMEYEAETDHDALPTASRVQIVAVVGGDSVAVVPVHEPARTNYA
jgi:membrane protein implicated in regulation of membrane protease activity